MITDTILISIGIIGLFFASIFDMKTREVPDWLNYALICSGLGLRLIYSIYYNSWSYFLFGLIGFSLMFLLGFLAYHSKQFGGGDAKIFMALGALFATGPSKFFLPGLLTNMLIAGALYGLIFSLVLAIKHKDKLKKELDKMHDKNKKLKRTSLLISFLLLILMFMFQTIFLKIILASIILIMLTYAYVLSFVRAVEKTCLLKYIDVNKLTEGDWVQEDIYLNEKLVYSKKTPGLEKHHINLIKKTGIKKVLVREGIPFVPPIFIALIITLIVGNILLLIL